jgi:hypothetical protein
MALGHQTRVKRADRRELTSRIFEYSFVRASGAAHMPTSCVPATQVQPRQRACDTCCFLPRSLIPVCDPGQSAQMAITRTEGVKVACVSDTRPAWKLRAADACR